MYNCPLIVSTTEDSIVFSFGKKHKNTLVKIYISDSVTDCYSNTVKKREEYAITDKNGEFSILNLQGSNNTTYRFKLVKKYKQSYNMLLSMPYDGVGNNKINPIWGSVNQELFRISGYGYDMENLPRENINPRDISNRICNAPSPIILNDENLTVWLPFFGQFLDHEIVLTEPGDEKYNIITPNNEYEVYKNYTIPFSRSKHVKKKNGIRDHLNELPSYLNNSSVYGNSSYRSSHLRDFGNNGKMKVSFSQNGETILPLNTEGLPNASVGHLPPEDFFLAGDIRANENSFLTAIHILFVREHNRLCDQIVNDEHSLLGVDEVIYQKARMINTGIVQRITENEFLPYLLGSHTMSKYKKYDNHINPNVSTEFSTVVYRFGHTIIPSILNVSSNDTRLLRELFFNPNYIKEHGVDDLYLGSTKTLMKEPDGTLIPDLRTFLFGPPTNSTLLDLATLNIVRGRDHGIPDYNTLRVSYGLTKKNTFSEITSKVQVQNQLQELYGNVDQIDPWIGGICEDKHGDSLLGELFTFIISDQFQRLRDGDEYYYENNHYLTEKEKCYIRSTTLADVIVRNSKWTYDDISNDVFHNYNLIN